MGDRPGSTKNIQPLPSAGSPKRPSLTEKVVTSGWDINHKPMFIVFEGINGSGKTTQINLLEKYLIEKYPSKEVVTTRQPGGSPIGEAIRNKLLGDSQDLSAKGIIPAGTLQWLEDLIAPGLKGVSLSDEQQAVLPELKLFLFDRALHLKNTVIPDLSRGAIVLCDRFTDSTIAFQGHGRGFPVDVLHRLNYLASFGFIPDLTFLIDLPVEEALSRIQDRECDRIEKESIKFHEKVMTGYLTLAKEQPGRRVILNGMQPPEQIHREIQLHIEMYFAVKAR